jgi:hypothetical protein
MLVLLPHCDDEIFVLFSNLKFIKNQSFDFCFMFKTFNSDDREKESKHFLRHFSKMDFNINFIYRKNQKLYDNNLNIIEVQILKEKLTNLIKQNNMILLPALEGGHQEHDLAALIVGQICRDIDYKGRLFCYSTYSLKKRFLYFGLSSKICHKIYTFNEAALILKIPFLYKSQVWTWVGLWPLFIKRLLCKQSISIIEEQSADNLTLDKLNLMSKTLYERRNKFNRTTVIKLLNLF